MPASTKTKRTRAVETDDEEEETPRSRRTAPKSPGVPARRQAAAPEPAPKKATSKGQNECTCLWDGRKRQPCGEMTGSRFAPGHDAKLKSRLVDAALDPKATEQARARAERAIEDLNWTDLLEKARASRAARAGKPKTAKGERTPAQKAATERMRAANAAKSKAQEAEDDDEDEEDDEVVDESEDDEDEADNDEDDEIVDEDDDEDESKEDDEEEEEEPEPPKAKAKTRRK